MIIRNNIHTRNGIAVSRERIPPGPGNNHNHIWCLHCSNLINPFYTLNTQRWRQQLCLCSTFNCRTPKPGAHGRAVRVPRSQQGPSPTPPAQPSPAAAPSTEQAVPAAPGDHTMCLPCHLTQHNEILKSLSKLNVLRQKSMEDV